MAEPGYVQGVGNLTPPPTLSKPRVVKMNTGEGEGEGAADSRFLGSLDVKDAEKERERGRERSSK